LIAEREENMSRDYRIKGTQRYLMWAGLCLLLALWAGRDGWFPSEAKLLKYPDPQAFFYVFNKGLACLGGIGLIVSLILHRLYR